MLWKTSMNENRIWLMGKSWVQSTLINCMRFRWENQMFGECWKRMSMGIGKMNYQTWFNRNKMKKCWKRDEMILHHLRTLRQIYWMNWPEQSNFKPRINWDKILMMRLIRTRMTLKIKNELRMVLKKGQWIKEEWIQWIMAWGQKVIFQQCFLKVKLKEDQLSK